MGRLARALTVAALAAPMPLVAQQPAASDTAARRQASAVTPQADQARGVDAELRAALFDLTAGRPLAALQRLEWLRSILTAPPSADTAPASGAAPDSAAVADSARGADGALRSRDDLLFLLAESYDRLGMGEAFRAAARELSASPGGARYEGVIASQLMLDAYQRGDYTGARELAAKAASAGDRPLAQLVAGLAAYHTGDFAAALSAFAGVRAAGGPYAPYAQYMEALTALAGDTTRVAAALDSLRPLAGIATGAFGDQVRLTAAELAYQSAQYDAAITYADGVAPSSGMGAQALLVKGWAQYRSGALDAAAHTFGDFASRYPELPQRDEARLMVGQSLLEAGQSEAAERYFQAMGDSIAGEVATLQARATTALAGAARALVAARAAGIAFVGDPMAGKTVALPDAAGADAATVLAAFSGESAPPSRVPPRIVSITDVGARLDSVGPSLDAQFPRRLMFMHGTDSGAVAVYADRASALHAADVNVALARYRLDEQVGAHAAKIAALEELQGLVRTGNESLAAYARILTATQDSLTAMRVVIDRTRGRVRQALATQLDATRTMASENVAMIDSVRSALGASAGTAEGEILDTERQTAETYARMAADVDAGLDSAVGRHPVFALRDSLAARLARARALHDETQQVLAADDQVVSGALAGLHASESEGTKSMRGALATAQARQAAAEGELVALVESELRARSSGMLAQLGRDREQADYGSASSAFFRATEQNGAAGATTGAAGGAGSAPASSASSSNPPRR